MSQKESGKRPQQQVAPPSFPPPSCPRCCSDNTKFCYYNNYTVSQPRYYCKDCRRYWTHGGAIRNIPTGGTSRKRGRIETASSTSQVLTPPATAWPGLGASGNPNGGGFDCATIGRRTFRPPITETMLSFNGGGHSNQTTFRFSAGGELGGVNTALGAVSVGFGGGALPPVDGFRDFGFHGVQPPQHHPLPPPSAWTTGQNMVFNSTSTTVSIARDPAASLASAHVVGVNEWCELNDIDYEGDPLRS